MVAHDVEHAVVTGIAGAPHGATLIIFGDRAVLVLVQPGNIDGGHAGHGALDPVALGVVVHIRPAHRAVLLELRQPVLGVVDQVIGRVGNAPGRIAVRVVPVLLVARRRAADVGHGMFVHRSLVGKGCALDVGKVDLIIAFDILSLHLRSAVLSAPPLIFGQFLSN